MQIQCPHCQVAIQVVEETLAEDTLCPSCGSRISSAERSKSTPLITPPASDGRETTLLPASPSGLPFTPPPASQTASASAATQPTAPQRPPMIEAFGRFQLLKRLGGGAYGEVFWAYDPQLDRDVAIKRPHQRRLPPELAERFAREARSAAQLQHRHIVGTYEVGEVDGRPYIASEYILGTDLAALANAQKDQNRLLPPRDIAQLCAQVAEALHVAHEAGIVHRDLKPANILVKGLGARDQGFEKTNRLQSAASPSSPTPNPQPLIPYLTDFGMAKRDTEAEYVMTQAGQLLGSPAYMSPEQWQDSHAVDRRTDLWAVGVILFELLTGERPFRAERDQKLLMQQILNADPPPPSQLNSQVPADLDTLCLKCLEKDPSRRFPTAAALAQELHRFLHGEPIHSRPITQWERAWRWCRRNPMSAFAYSMAFILVILLSNGFMPADPWTIITLGVTYLLILRFGTRFNQAAEEKVGAKSFADVLVVVAGGSVIFTILSVFAWKLIEVLGLKLGLFKTAPSFESFAMCGAAIGFLLGLGAALADKTTTNPPDSE